MLVPRLIVGITGATGAIVGVRLLQALRAANVESHLILSKWGLQTVEHETGLGLVQLRELASVVHSTGNMAATVSSGSFRTDGMAIAPCSMRTLAAIASGNGENLVHRAADVVLKERRRLVLVVAINDYDDIKREARRLGMAVPDGDFTLGTPEFSKE